MYPKNVGRLDRLIRFVIGLVLLPVGLLPLGGLDGEPLGIAAAVVGFVALASAVSGRCPGYVPFGIDTRRREREVYCGPPRTAG